MELSPAFQNNAIFFFFFFTKLVWDLDIWELVFESESLSFVEDLGVQAAEMEW